MEVDCKNLAEYKSGRHKKIVMNKNVIPHRVSLLQSFCIYLLYIICGLFSHYNDLLYMYFSNNQYIQFSRRTNKCYTNIQHFFIEGDLNEREHLSKLLLCVIVFILL